VCDDIFIAELRFVQLIAGKDNAAFLLNCALSCFQYRGNAGGNAIFDSVRSSVLSGAPLACEAGYRDDLGSCNVTTFKVFWNCARAASASVTQEKDRVVKA